MGHAELTIEGDGPPYRTLLWCHGCASGYDNYVQEVADCAGVTVRELLDDPLEHLEIYLGRQTTSKPPAPLPTQHARQAARAALWGHAGRLGYLTATRGLSAATIRRYKLGFDTAEDCYVLPVYQRGRLVNVVEHRPKPKPPKKKYMAATGHSAALYPNLPSCGAVVLVAGMFDALSARQADLPACTTTCGTSFPDHLAVRFAAKRAAVVFDASEYEQAERAVAKLLAIGARSAWPVRLPEGEGDVNDFFVNGGSRAELLDLIKRERP